MADTILEEIAAKTRERVAAAKRRVPPAEMERRARALGAQTGFPFEAALRGKDIAFICEVKRASPSKGMIAPEFPYRQIALEYEAAGAAAVSVITEPGVFSGDRRVSFRHRGGGGHSGAAQGFHGGQLHDL